MIKQGTAFWCFLLLALVFSCVVQSFGNDSLLSFDRSAILSGEYWRLITGGWLHHNAPHMLMNLLALSILWCLLIPPLTDGFCLLLLVLLVSLVDLGILILVPKTQHYWGLSGALHGLFAIATCLQFNDKKRLAALWLIGLISKLVWDTAHLDDTTAQLIGTRVHVESHILGSMAGLAIGLALLLWQRQAQRSRVNLTTKD